MRNIAIGTAHKLLLNFSFSRIFNGPTTQSVALKVVSVSYSKALSAGPSNLQNLKKGKNGGIVVKGNLRVQKMLDFIERKSTQPTKDGRPQNQMDLD